MYDRILVPTDGSTGMRPVIEHAIDLAMAHGATIHGVFVVNSASYASLPMETSWEGVNEMLEEDGVTALQTIEDAATDAEIPVKTKLLKGSPSREIVHYAEREDCDLIVMGTHGRGGIDRLLLGSVAERVVRGSTVPVLTVRVGEPSEEFQEQEPEGTSAD